MVADVAVAHHGRARLRLPALTSPARAGIDAMSRCVSGEFGEADRRGCGYPQKLALSAAEVRAPTRPSAVRP